MQCHANDRSESLMLRNVSLSSENLEQRNFAIFRNSLQVFRASYVQTRFECAGKAPSPDTDLLSWQSLARTRIIFAVGTTSLWRPDGTTPHKPPARNARCVSLDGSTGSLCCAAIFKAVHFRCFPIIFRTSNWEEPFLERDLNIVSAHWSLLLLQGATR